MFVWGQRHDTMLGVTWLCERWCWCWVLHLVGGALCFALVVAVRVAVHLWSDGNRCVKQCLKLHCVHSHPPSRSLFLHPRLLQREDLDLAFDLSLAEAQLSVAVFMRRSVAEHASQPLLWYATQPAHSGTAHPSQCSGNISRARHSWQWEPISMPTWKACFARSRSAASLTNWPWDILNGGKVRSLKITWTWTWVRPLKGACSTLEPACRWTLLACLTFVGYDELLSESLYWLECMPVWPVWPRGYVVYNYNVLVWRLLMRDRLGGVVDVGMRLGC